MALRRPPLAAAALLALILSAHGAAAHASYTTTDGRYRIVVGNLNEPVTTYTKTGLDLMLQSNDTARSPVILDPGNLTATLVAPDGTATLSHPLRAQFGKPGAYTFSEPYHLTRPGQYTLRLQGAILGTPVDGTYNVAGPVGAMANTTFPDAGLADLKGLQQQAQALQASLRQAEARLAALEASKDGHDAPAPTAALLMVGLAALALLARRPDGP